VHDYGQSGILDGERDQSTARETSDRQGQKKDRKTAHDTYLSGRPQTDGGAGGSGVERAWPGFSG
jgi:hypothetical protein